MQKTIIALSGKKQSGKNTAGDFIKTYCHEEFRYCYLGCGFDNFFKEYSLADGLKQFCENILSISHEQLWGTDEEKMIPTQYRWEDMPDFFRWRFGDSCKIYEKLYNATHDGPMGIEDYYIIFYDSKIPVSKKSYRTGPITAREIMQIVGTDLMRFAFPGIWYTDILRKIKNSSIPINIITDCRFSNEILAVLDEPNSYVFRLTRDPFVGKIADRHISETCLDNFEWNRPNCFVIDNFEMNIQEQFEAIAPILNKILQKT